MPDLKVKNNDFDSTVPDPSDIKIENRYWRICLGFLCVSPVLIYWLQREPLVFDLMDIRYFPVAAILSLPAAMILELFLSWAADPAHPPKLFVRRPSVRITADIGRDFESRPDDFTKRLSKLGFQIEPGQTEHKVHFSKPKSTTGVHKFSDHAFSGELTSEETNFGRQVHLELIFEDIILLESGEGRKMKALAEFLVGRSEEPFFRDIHLLLLEGLVATLAVHLLLYLKMLGLADITFLVFPCATAGASLVLVALLIMSFNRSKYIGFRLAVIALILAGTPYVPNLINWLHGVSG